MYEAGGHKSDVFYADFQLTQIFEHRDDYEREHQAKNDSSAFLKFRNTNSKKQLTTLIVNGCFNFALVQSWIQKCEGGNIFKLDKVIFPIHRDGSHWACGAVAFMKTKHICNYDSSLVVGSDGKTFTDGIMKCLREEWGYQYYQSTQGRFSIKRLDYK